MISIISPSQFRIIPWKNGKGETTELAINEGASLAQFDWRISIASVVEDGMFSDFSGYERNLILIAGAGINLQHDHQKIDKLATVLSYATFDGACQTIGNLHAGPITDFNVITAKDKYQVQVNTFHVPQIIPLQHATLCFIYSLIDDFAIIDTMSSTTTHVSQGCLAKITTDALSMLQVSGQQLIIVYLYEH